MNTQHGTFTVILPDETRRTLRVIEPNDGVLVGKLIIQFQSGSDNERDYISCAFMREDKRNFTLWKRFAQSGLDRYIRVLFVRGGAKVAGLAYALESGHCFRCNRTLTVPASLHAGMGPDCAAKAS